MEERPVLTAAMLVALATAVLSIIAALGVPISADLKVALLSAISIIAPLAVWKLQSGKTTPIVNPKDEHGNELVRKDTGTTPARAAIYRSKKGLDIST